MTNVISSQPISANGFFARRGAAAFDGGEELHRRVVAQIIDAVSEIRGSAAADLLRSQGVEALHTIIGADEIGPIRDRVIEGLRNDLLTMAVKVGRSLMRWDGDFYVDDYLILRVNFPYEVARHSNPTAENPGIGRISPWMREMASSRRVNDPLYNPKGYHKGHPPAAWAHGPHVDSWSGHSRDGLNIWWAVGDVPAEAGMILYPELAEKSLPCDRRTLYLQAGYRLPKPTHLPLQSGEMLVFDPEILHGTHLNLTNKTRVAISLRLNANKPTFDPGCFYAREFWRLASDIERSRFDRVLHLKREDNLAAASAEVHIDRPEVPKDLQPRARQPRKLEIGPQSLVRDGHRVVVTTPIGRVMLHRIDGVLRAVKAACPHYGVDLSDGASDGRTLYCPACGIAFDIESGKSHTPSLTLQFADVREEDGVIVLDLPETAAA